MMSLYIIDIDVLVSVFGGKIMRRKKSLQNSRQTDRCMPAVFRYRMLIIAIFLVALVFVGGVSAGVSTPTPTTTQTPSSPVPVIGIIAGLGAVALLLRRE